MINEVKKLAAKYFDVVLELRRNLHQNPELSFQEFNTSLLVQDFLKTHNISFKSGFVKTGIVAEIKGEKKSNKELVLRADMDALPIKEENEVPYKSKMKGLCMPVVTMYTPPLC